MTRRKCGQCGNITDPPLYRLAGGTSVCASCAICNAEQMGVPCASCGESGGGRYMTADDCGVAPDEGPYCRTCYLAEIEEEADE